MRFRLAMVKGAGLLLLTLAVLQGGVQASAAADAEAPRGGFWQRSHPMTVERGILTVNGLTVKTGMTFRIADLHYLYIDVPGTGTAVISDRPFAGAREQRRAFRGGTLTVAAGENRLQLTSMSRMRGTRSAWVRMDGGSRSGSRVPEVGYGSSIVAPVTWVRDAGGLGGGRRRVRLTTRRPLREAKLCRPSPKGKELCAIIREVRYRD